MPAVKAKFALWSFGGGRPFGCDLGDCERWHAGIDLTGAVGGALVVSPEDATVVAVDRGWSSGSKAIFLRTDTGLFLVLGGVIKGSSKEFDVEAGQLVKRGDSLGRVLGSYGMIHFETYVADDRTKNSPWWKGQPPPPGLLNPTNYVERMIGDRISLVRTIQRHEALAELGYYVGPVDSPWGETSKAALLAAQEALGVKSDGVWGPNTEDAILGALAKAEGSSKGKDKDKEPAKSADGPRPATNADPSRWGWLTVAGVTVATGATIGAIWHAYRKKTRQPSGGVEA
jgi:hypothetical protein